MGSVGGGGGGGGGLYQSLGINPRRCRGSPPPQKKNHFSPSKLNSYSFRFCFLFMSVATNHLPTKCPTSLLNQKSYLTSYTFTYYLYFSIEAGASSGIDITIPIVSSIAFALILLIFFLAVIIICAQRMKKSKEM